MHRNGVDNLGDWELMAQVRSGDFAAFDVLYHRHQSRVRRFAMSLTWNADLAEDYVQEVFCRLWHARGRYVPEGSLSAYLLQITKNHYLSERRKRLNRGEDKQVSFEQRNGHIPLETLPANRRIEPEVHLLEGYRRFRIQEAIDALPDTQKLVFVLAHLEGLRYDEIAEVLDVPVGTVKSRMFHAVRRLQSLLQEIKP